MKKLKQEGFDMPIVVLTGNIVDGAKETFLNEGFYYLEKPINRSELDLVINKFLK